MKIRGVKAAKAKVVSEIAARQKKYRAGLLAGALVIEAESKRRVPREYGNLIGSAYTRKNPNNEFSVQIGYAAAYALWVHENIEMKLKGKPRPSGLGVYWGPKGQSQYLSSALADKRAEAIKVLKSYGGSRK